MYGFKLKKHSVKKAAFVENMDKEKKNKIKIGVEGGILIPKAYDENKQVRIKLKFCLGDSEERFYLTLETLSIFESEQEKIDLSEEAVHKACLPVALSSLRETVKLVTAAYGMPAIDLPPFEEEMEEFT